jgi:hypothetical protein
LGAVFGLYYFSILTITDFDMITNLIAKDNLFHKNNNGNSSEASSNKESNEHQNFNHSIQPSASKNSINSHNGLVYNL